jgi:hypothetical protein
MPDWIDSIYAQDIGLVALAVGGATLQGWLAFIRPQKQEMAKLVDAVVNAWRVAEAKQAEALQQLEARTLEGLNQAQLAFAGQQQKAAELEAVLSSVALRLEELSNQNDVQLANARTVYDQFGEALMELSGRVDQQAELSARLVETLERRPAPVGPAPKEPVMLEVPALVDMPERLRSLQAEFVRRRNIENGAG